MLNVSVPHKLVCFDNWSLVCGTILESYRTFGPRNESQGMGVRAVPEPFASPRSEQAELQLLLAQMELLPWLLCREMYL